MSDESRQKKGWKSVTGHLIGPGTIEGSDLPDLGDLTERLRFSLRDGQIWLDTQRVALIHLSTLTSLRRELIDKLGVEDARGFLARMGYASGCRDAALARKLRPHCSVKDAMLVGPQLRAIQGVISLQPVQLEADLEKGTFFGEFTFSGSFEADAQIADFGLSNTSSCWMQVGYASGYISTFMGRDIVFKEIECRASGSQSCRMIGKPLRLWDDIEEELVALRLNREGAHALAARNATRLRNTPGSKDDIVDCTTLPHGIVGNSSGFVVVCQMLRKVANTDATVLFLGETGVGKEMFAKMLHRMGKRSDKPFVAVNCAAIPENLLESELFGVEKGAFTGAIQSRAGRFERADGGTLFLDEVGTLTLAAQIKLLRSIQEQEVERVGDTVTRKVNVRIIAATNVDLKEAVDQGTFRDDLMYRLNVFPVRIPPLRERREDIPPLMEFFLDKYSSIHGKKVTGFSRRAMDALYEYSYPGNIRELENLIERAVILADDDQPIDLSHLFAPEDLQASMVLKLNSTGNLEQSQSTDNDTRSDIGVVMKTMLNDGISIEDLEHRLMEKAVELADGKLSKAARMLGITRPQLAYRLKKYQESTLN